MRIKKFIIPVMSMVILVSCLTGCAAAGSKEMLGMLQEGQSIEIEVAMPDYVQEKQGTESTGTWEELGSQDNYRDMRLTFDDVFMNHSFDEGKKNGPSYIDLEGNWTNNSTFYYAMMNQKFAETLRNSDTRSKLIDASNKNYADMEALSDEEKILGVLNGYFDIFSDNEPNYANLNSTLTRGEFMAGLVKADTPVQDISDTSLVEIAGEGKEEEAKLASQALSHSYLDIESKSLDSLTYNGTITRGEAVYMVVQRYFADEYATIDTMKSPYADIKNAGNVSERAGFVEKGSTEKPDHWKAYTLSIMLKNIDRGMDTELFNAMVVASNHHLLGDITESKWEEGLTRGEAIALIERVYEAIAIRDGYSVNAIDGLNQGNDVSRDTGSGSSTEETGDSLTFIEGNGAGTDSLTDEEIEEQIKEEAERQQAESKAVDGDYDEFGNNKKTGEYDPYHDTQGGKGIDWKGQHFDTVGEYDEALNSKEQQQKEKEWQEANGARELTEEQQQMINDAFGNGKVVIFGPDGEVQVKDIGQ